MRRPLLHFLKVYKKSLEKYPLGTQIMTTSILMGSGDAIAQILVEKKNFDTFKYLRTCQFIVIGGVIIGPAMTMWYRALSHQFGSRGTPLVALKKVICDQGIFAPVFLGVFMISLDALQGKTWDYTKNEISEKYCDILTSNYCVWPICALINFYFTPLQYQVLVTNVLALFWNTYISWITQMELDEFEAELPVEIAKSAH